MAFATEYQTRDTYIMSMPASHHDPEDTSVRPQPLRADGPKYRPAVLMAFMMYLAAMVIGGALILTGETPVLLTGTAATSYKLLFGITFISIAAFYLLDFVQSRQRTSQMIETLKLSQNELRKTRARVAAHLEEDKAAYRRSRMVRKSASGRIVSGSGSAKTKSASSKPILSSD